ncbi:NAD(P)-dependent alcohol dehydrogenase [Flavobacteriaceae bacterium 3-367]
MKAMVWTKYGPPELMQLQEVEQPVPKDNEVLVKVHAATVTAGDCELRRFDIATWIWLPVRLYMGILKPRIHILGQEVAGEVEAVGAEVKGLKPGDAIFAECGMGFGAYAQYLCLSNERVICHKPEHASYEEAATIPTGGINALHFLRKGNVTAGEHLLINGAGGSIGTYLLQLAKMAGAEVSCVDRGNKLDMLLELGADHVIDCTKQDFTKNAQTYDVIIDIVGGAPYKRTVNSLRMKGRYVLGNPRLPAMLRGLWTSWTTNKKVISALASYKLADFLYLKELMEAGKLKAVIDKRYPLEQLVEAHRYVEQGHKKGHVIITPPQD